MQTCFTISLWLTKLLSIRLKLFISLKPVLKMSSIFSRNKLMVPIVLFQSLWMFFRWLVFTSNLISQTTWLAYHPDEWHQLGHILLRTTALTYQSCKWNTVASSATLTFCVSVGGIARPVDG